MNKQFCEHFNGFVSYQPVYNTYYKKRGGNDTDLLNEAEYIIWIVDILLAVNNPKSRRGTHYLQLWK